MAGSPSRRQKRKGGLSTTSRRALRVRGAAGGPTAGRRRAGMQKMRQEWVNVTGRVWGRRGITGRAPSLPARRPQPSSAALRPLVSPSPSLLPPPSPVVRKHTMAGLRMIVVVSATAFLLGEPSCAYAPRTPTDPFLAPVPRPFPFYPSLPSRRRRRLHHRLK